MELPSAHTSQSLAENAVALRTLDYRPEQDVDPLFENAAPMAWESPVDAESAAVDGELTDAAVESAPPSSVAATHPIDVVATLPGPAAVPSLDQQPNAAPEAGSDSTGQESRSNEVLTASPLTTVPGPSNDLPEVTVATAALPSEPFAVQQALESLHSANGPPGVSGARLHAPGPSATIEPQTINGDYTLTAASQLVIEIAGTSNPNGYDVITVTGKAELAGTLKIVLVGNPAFSVGNTIDFLTFTSVEGDFAAFEGLQIGDGLYFQPVLQPVVNNAAQNKYQLQVAKLPDNVDVDANPSQIADAFLALMAGKNAGPVSLGASFNLNVLGVAITGSVEGAVEKPANESPITTLRAESVSLSFVGGGGEIVKLTGSGSIIITKDGLAGTLNVAATLSASNATLAAGARGSLTLILNTTNAPVDKAVKVGDRVVVFDLPQGPYIRVIARDVELTFTTEGSQFTLVGNLDIERQANGEVNVEVTGAGLNLATGTATVEFKEGLGALTFTKDGVAGVAKGTASLRGVDGLVLSGSFDLEFNNTGVLFKKTIGTTVLDFEGTGEGNVLRIGGNGLLGVADFLDLQAAFLIRRTTDGPNGPAEVEVGASGSVNNTPFQFAALISGNGTFALAGSVVLTDFPLLDQVILNGAFGLRLNTTDREINRTVRVGGTDLPLVFGATEKKSVRFVGTGLQLVTPVGEMGGDFTFEKNLTTGRMLVAADQISLFVGDRGTLPATTDDIGILIAQGHLAMAIEPSGAAAFRVGGTAAVVGLTSELEFVGDLFAEWNTTGFDADLTGVDPDDAGPLVAPQWTVPAGARRFGADQAALKVGGGAFQLAGSFVIEESDLGPDSLPGTTDDAPEIWVAASGVRVFVGDDSNPSNRKGVAIDEAQLALVIGAGQTYALQASGNAAIVGVPGVTISGRVGVERNTRTQAVSRTIEVGGTTVGLDVAAAPFSRIGGENVVLEVLGQKLTGNFTLTDSGTDVAVTIKDANLEMGGGALVIEDVDAGFTLKPVGVVGTFSASNIAINVPGASFSGGIQVDIDTTVASPYFRVTGTGMEFKVGEPEQVLVGNFVFEEQTAGPNATGRSLKVAADSVSLTLASESNGPALVSITGASGALLVTDQGVAGQIVVPNATVNVPGLLTGSFAAEIQFNTLTEAVQTTVATTTLDLPAGVFLRVEVVVPAASAITVPGGKLSGAFAIEIKTGPSGLPVRVIGLSGVSATLGNNAEAGLVDGEGAFVIKTTGVAGMVSGTANLQLGDVAAGGSVLLRVNQTGDEVDEVITVAGQPIAIRFGKGEANVFAISVSDLSLNIANVVTIEGSVAFAKGTALSKTRFADTFAGTGLKVFFGDGPATLATGDPNPLARGFLLTDAKVALLKFADGTYAMDASGTVQVIGIPDLTLGGTVRVRVNSTEFNDLDEVLTIPGTEDEVYVTFNGDRQGGGGVNGTPNAKLSGIGLNLAVGGQSLSGDFTFEKLVRDPNNTPSIAGDDVRVLKLEASNVRLSLTDGTTDFLSLSDGYGEIFILPNGVVGAVGGTVGVNLPGVALGGTFDFLFNTSPVASTEVLTVGTGASARTLNGLPGGPYVRVSGRDASITVQGQRIAGDFDFERLSQPDGSRVTRLGILNGRFTLGSEVSDILSVSNGRGSLLVTQGGLAGEFSAQVSINPAAIDFSITVDTFSVAVNTTGEAIDESFSVGGQDIELLLPAGPYVRAEFAGAQVALLGQTLTGNFAFEQAATPGNDGLINALNPADPVNADNGRDVRVAVSEVGLNLGSGLIVVSEGEGIFLLANNNGKRGFAGRLGAKVAANIPGVELSADFALEINQTATVIDETFTVGGTDISLQLPAGPYLRVAGEAAKLNILGQTLTGNFRFTQSGGVTQLAFDETRLDLGDGLLVVSEGAGAFTVTASGIAGSFAGKVGFGIEGIRLSVQQLTVEVDTTAPASRYLRVSGTGVGVSIAGQTLVGNFVFEETTDEAGASIVKVAASGVSLRFGNGQQDFVNITGASGQLLITRAGVAGGLTLSGNIFSIPGLTIGTDPDGFVRIEINTIPNSVEETFSISGMDTVLTLPSGPFVRVTVIRGSVEIARAATLKGNFSFDQSSRPNEQGALETITRLAVSNVSVQVEVGGESGSLVDGAGAFVIVGGGVAGMFSGRADIKVGPIDAGGNLLVRVNNTPSVVDETFELDGQTINLRFSEDEIIDFFDVSVSNLSLKIGEFVTVEGSILVATRLVETWAVPVAERNERTTSTKVSAEVFAGEGLEIFLGRGPPRLENGDLNPLAAGVLLSNAKLGFIRFGTGPATKYALTAEGTVQLLGINGVVIRGTAVVRVNTAEVILDETITIDGSNGPGVRVAFDSKDPVERFEALDAELSVLGQTLSGNFSFDQVSTGSGPTAPKTLRIAATDVSLSLGDGANGVRITNGSGALISTGAGIAGSIQATVGLQIPGVDFAGVFSVALNTTGIEISQIFTVGTSTIALSLPAGPYLRVEGVGVRLSIAGQTLTGDFAFEQVTPAGAATPVTTITARNVSFSIQAGGADVVTLTRGRGAFVVRDTGLAGEIGGSVALNLPAAVEFRGDFTLRINNTNVEVDEQFAIGGETFDLELPAGPYVQVTGLGVALKVLGQSLTGDFAFEQITSYGADRLPGGTGINADTAVTRIAASNVSLNLGDGLLVISQASGALFITPGAQTTDPKGLAGAFDGQVALDVPGVELSGKLTIEFNTRTVEVKETFKVGTVQLPLDLPSGPYVRVAGDDVRLVIAGQSLTGDFAFTQTVDANAQRSLQVDVAEARLGLGGPSDKPVLEVTVATGRLVMTAAGAYGEFQDVGVHLNLGAATLNGTFHLALNTTRSVQGDLPAGPYVRIESETIQFSVLGQTLNGKFVFEQVTTTDGASILRVAANEVELTLGSADAGVVVSDGQGAFIITPAGVAGRLSASVSVRPTSIRVGGTFGLAINTTGDAVEESFRIGSTITSLSLPAGPFVQVTGDNVFVEIAGQKLTGNFAFQQLTIDRGLDGLPATSDDVKAVRIAASEVSLSFGDGTTNFLSVTDGEGYFLILPTPVSAPAQARTGIAGRLSVTASLNIPGVTLSGTLEIEVNNTQREIDEVFFVAGLPKELKLEAGDFVRVSGQNIEVGVVGQTLKGNFRFERAVDQPSGNPIVKVSFDRVEVGLGDGTNTFVRITEAEGFFKADRQGMVADFEGVVAVDVPGVNFGGKLDVHIDTAADAFTITGTSIELTIAGQQIGADSFVIEQITGAGPDGKLGNLADNVVSPEEVDNDRVVRIAIDNLSLALGEPAHPFINITAANNVDGAILINKLGLAATFTGNIDQNVFDLPGNLAIEPAPSKPAIKVAIEINTIPAAVKT
ncbi:MAG: hypothetical protein JNK85_10640, partial [Verrucomicrobiales bacterium]|nr:hypothetical protein [Verrucomicrobiales bacterium]